MEESQVFKIDQYCIIGHIYLCLGIIKPPNRFEIKKGEIKKEFDEMRMKINEEEKQRELRSLELAKKLQVN